MRKRKQRRILGKKKESAYKSTLLLSIAAVKQNHCLGPAGTKAPFFRTQAISLLSSFLSSSAIRLRLGSRGGKSRIRFRLAATTAAQ
jgi:hypothetical protein